MTTDPRWSVAAGLILFAVALLSACHWPVYPYFLDSYYHLSVIQGFIDAGGPVTHAFWEAAPAGRPHLYPPLFHLLFLPIRLMGVGPIPLARFWTWASFPLLLGVAWRVTRRLGTNRRAALTVFLLAAPYSFFLGSINFVPATLVLIAALGIALALERSRWLAAGLFLGLAFWTHAGLPWLLALSILIFGLISRPHRKSAFLALGIGLLAASPWLIQQARHLALLQLQPRGEDHQLETPLLAVALGLWGIRPAWKEGGLSRFWIALGLGFLPMMLGYRARFLSTQGLFPFLMLGGIALDHLAERIRLRGALPVLLALILLGSPSLHFSPQGRQVAWGDTPLGILSGIVPPIPRGTAAPLYHSKFMGELAAAARAHTQPDELIFCNIHYLGGMLSVLSGRATTNQMLREMADRPLEDQIRPARLIVWVKDPAGRFQPTGGEAAAFQFHLRPLGETKLAALYYNPYADGRRRTARAVIPWWLALGIMGLAAGLAFRDLARP